MRNFLKIILCFLSLLQALYSAEVYNLTTKNGINFWFMKDTSVPVVSIRYSFKEAGNSYVKKELSGINNLVSQLLLHGAGNRTSKEFRELLAQHSIEMGFYSDKDCFYGEFKTTLRSQKLAISMLKDILYNPILPEDKLSIIKIKSVINLQNRFKDPDYLIDKVVTKKLYGKHPYGHDATEKSLNNVKIKDIKEFIKTKFTKNNLNIAICGNLTKDQALSLVESVFSNLITSKQDNISLPSLKIDYSNKVHVTKKNIPQSICSFYHKGLDYSDSNILLLMLLNHILGGDFTSRLMQAVRVHKGYAYSIHTGLINNNHVSHLLGKLGSDNKTVMKAIGIIKKEFVKMSAFGITEAELDDAKRALIGRSLIKLSSTGAIASQLLFYKQHNFPLTYLNERGKMIQSIQLVDINKFAKSFFNADNLVFFIVGDPQTKG